MTSVNQLIYGNEVSLPLSSVKIGELFYDDSSDKIIVYKKTKNRNIIIKIVDSYGELYDIKGLNKEPQISNFILLNP